MSDSKILLVAVDFSEGSRRATQVAVDLARATGAELALVAVFDLPVYASSLGAIPGGTSVAVVDEFMEKVREGVAADLAKLADELSGDGLTVRSQLAEGVPAAAILSVAEELDAGMIVMGTHGRTGFQRWVLGSVAERVVRTAHCPVLTVPLGGPPEDD